LNLLEASHTCGRDAQNNNVPIDLVHQRLSDRICSRERKYAARSRLSRSFSKKPAPRRRMPLRCKDRTRAFLAAHVFGIVADAFVD